MRLTDTGRLGIGTSAPTYELDVVGNIGLDQYLYHNDDTDTYLNFTEDSLVATIGNEALITLTENDTQDIIEFGDEGDVDIKLSAGADGALFVEGSSGNVGIGTTAPSQELHVQGNMRLTGALYDGNNEAGSSDQILSSTGAAVDWVNASTVGGIPAGGLIMWGGTIASIPSGYLRCDGSAVSRTTYANLFSAIGTIHGSGDGSTTFNLPDLRDRFVVGAKQDDSGVPKTNLTGSLTQSGGSITTSGESGMISDQFSMKDIVRYTGNHTHQAIPPYYTMVYIIKT